MRAPRLLALACLVVCACPASSKPPLQVSSRVLPIVHGTADTVPSHAAVVALSNAKGFFCSGTLIAPRVVLTAGHCVKLVSQVGLKAGFGQDITDSATVWVAAAESKAHPGFDQNSLQNDIALVRLAAPPPGGIAPIPPLPASRALGQADVGAVVDFSGFGDTETGTFGAKLHVSDGLDLVCETAGGCAFAGDVAPQNSICYDQQPGGPCSGDSGGPAFLLRAGTEYVAGVTSFGDSDCSTSGCSTKVDAFGSFISAFVGQIGTKNDGAACAGGSECQTGFCVDGFCCNVACGKDVCSVCSAAKGAVADGQCTPKDVPCNDQNACTDDDHCVEGLCEGTPRLCPVPDACHQTGVCDPKTGLCGPGPDAADGTPCDDLDECTTGDACKQGVCTGRPRSFCPAPDSCHKAAACTDKKCGEHAPKADGSPCEDGDPCTLGDACVGGVCTGAPKVCPPTPCHGWGRCDVATGDCILGVTLGDGAACDDDNPCTQNDTCQAGSCSGVVTAGACAAQQCRESGTCQSDGTCNGAPFADGTACIPFLDKCAAGSCQSGTCVAIEPKDCTPPDVCHVGDTCDPLTGHCSWTEAPAGTACDDGSRCTTLDHCDGFTCTGTPVVCAEPQECYAKGICNPKVGLCIYGWAPDGTACSTGTCRQGACKSTGGCATGTGSVPGGLALAGLCLLVRRRVRAA